MLIASTLLTISVCFLFLVSCSCSRRGGIGGCQLFDSFQSTLLVRSLATEDASSRVLFSGGTGRVSLGSLSLAPGSTLVFIVPSSTAMTLVVRGNSSVIISANVARQTAPSPMVINVTGVNVVVSVAVPTGTISAKLIDFPATATATIVGQFVFAPSFGTLSLEADGVYYRERSAAQECGAGSFRATDVEACRKCAIGTASNASNLLSPSGCRLRGRTRAASRRTAALLAVPEGCAVVLFCFLFLIITVLISRNLCRRGCCSVSARS